MRTTSTTCSATSAPSTVKGPCRVFDRAVVVIPAHNEADHLPSCVKAVLTAAACLPLPVAVVVVLDGCDDGSAALAGQFGSDVHFVTIDARNVGAARAAGFSYARTLCEQAVLDDSRIWYATTDADSVVDPDWLLRQTGADTDMVLGVVRIATWREFPAAAARRYLAAYRSKTHPDGNGHGHVHGANMGFRADSYWRVGGFAALASDEDVDLVARFESAGLRIVRDTQLSVVTSRRRLGRAPGGFAAHLRSMLTHARAEPA
jgi:glycosyltransferase involved in cell wall biosynthesis